MGESAPATNRSPVRFKSRTPKSPLLSSARILSTAASILSVTSRFQKGGQRQEGTRGRLGPILVAGAHPPFAPCGGILASLPLRQAERSTGAFYRLRRCPPHPPCQGEEYRDAVALVAVSWDLNIDVRRYTWLRQLAAGFYMDRKGPKRGRPWLDSEEKKRGKEKGCIGPGIILPRFSGLQTPNS